MLRNRGKENGSALVVCMIMAVAIAVLLGGLVTVNLTSSKAAFASNSRIARSFAADAGLQRAKQIITINNTNEAWLPANATGGPLTLPEGGTSFLVGESNVQISITALGTEWYMVQSTATDSEGGTLSIGMTMRPRSFFSDYARFVSAGDLSVGANASYDGKVHSNGKILATGNGIVFYDDVTSFGAISKQADTKFMKNATSGVDKIELPEAAELEALCTNPPAGALVYDWDNAAFKAKFLAATGKNPNSTLDVSVTFKNNKMDVVSKCTVSGVVKTFTETAQDVPDKNAIFVRGTANVVGNISRRTSVITPKALSVTGPLRYVDDNGGALWELKDATTGAVKAFSTATNSWTPTDDWTNQSVYSYQQASDWNTRAGVATDSDTGAKVIPCLGLVSGAQMYIKGDANTNREIHGAFFTSGGVVNASVNSTKKNLWMHGCLITTGTNPLSGSFSYRRYAYDPNLRNFPPPSFPTNSIPSFSNWHVVSEGN